MAFGDIIGGPGKKRVYNIDTKEPLDIEWNEIREGGKYKEVIDPVTGESKMVDVTDYSAWKTRSQESQS